MQHLVLSNVVGNAAAVTLLPNAPDDRGLFVMMRYALMCKNRALPETPRMHMDLLDQLSIRRLDE